MRGPPVTPEAHPPASDQPRQEQPAGTGSSQEQPFVGRQSELRQLRAAFEAVASSGDGRLTTLVGEPGIGKTALSDQLCRFVSASGGLPLVGHCYEEGSFRRPYQPFVEVLGTYLHGLDIETLRAELGSSAADLALIVPTLRERLHVSPLPPGDPEEDRWRLLQAATDLLHSAAATQPLLVVLEDLHDADRGTLDLLLYLARNLHGARILVVGSYRDVDVDRAHPLSTALSELHRASNVARLHLRGLSTEEVQQLLAETSRQTIPQPFAELVHRQTDGNPLFVRETLQYVIEEGLVEQREGALHRVGEGGLAGQIPEGLRDAVGKRLSRLTTSTNRALSVASVIGREFHLDLLRQVAVRTEEELEDALEEASAAGVIEERSVVRTRITYRFSHAFFRQTLYDEIVAPRRIRLHLQVARALEQVNPRHLDEYAGELAEHYSFSSDVGDLSKAIHYGVLAAHRASGVFAYGEAARHLQRALEVQDVADPDDKQQQCDLLLSLGEALLPAGDTARAIAEIAPQALTLAEELGDRRRMFRACRLAIECLDAQGAATSTARPEYLLWAERAHQYADPDGIERVHANVALALAWAAHGRLRESRALLLEALELARKYRDPEALYKSTMYLIFSAAPQRWDERLKLADECVGWPRDGVSVRNQALVLWYSGCIQLCEGDRPRAAELWHQVEELAERTHVVTAVLFVLQRAVIEAIVDGRLEEALVLIQQLVKRADELGASLRGRQFGLQMLLNPALHLGRAHVWLTAFEEYAPSAGPFSETPALLAARAVCLAQVGQMEEARTLIWPRLDAVEHREDSDDRVMVGLAMLLQGAVAVGHREAARALAARLACVAHLSIGDWFYTCVARQLGEAAVLVGDLSVAREYYAQALESARKIRFRPELALTHASLAELLLQESNAAARSEALEHLHIAIPELQFMKMQPVLERALALKAKVEAAAVPHVPGRRSASDMLTAREREIASLMADGSSNRDIAEKLIISEGTVDVHVKHILGKLGFRSRAQVAGWFARQGPA
jgi:DNA-binding NarL/FixJ family response regulator